MKRSIFIILIVAFVTGSCTKNSKSHISGTWKIVYGVSSNMDSSVIFPQSLKDHYIKIIGEKYFCTIWQDTTLNRDNFWYSGFNGGTLTFENGIYTENISYFSSPSNIGKQYTFNAQFKSDTLILTLVSNYPDSIASYVEKMVRLK